MKKYKVVFLMLLSFLITGCTVDYNIEIKADSSVYENVNINGQKFNSEKEFKNIRKEIINQFSENLNKYNYKYEIKKGKNQIYVEINKKSNLKTLFENSLYNEVFEDYELFMNKEIKYFKTTGSNYLSNLFIIKNYEQNLKINRKVDKLRVNIKFENIVTSNNADQYNEKTNTYTWIFDKTNLNKTINFSYDITKKFKQKNSFEFKYVSIIMIILITIIILIISIIYINRKKM